MTIERRTVYWEDDGPFRRVEVVKVEDHERIVSSLTEAGVSLQRRVDYLTAEVERLTKENTMRTR